MIGSSTGYGLASALTACFGYGAKTLGVCFEKAPEDTKTATAGWYNLAEAHRLARSEGRTFETINGDAFSAEVKEEVVAALHRLGPADLVIYSLAAPRRKDTAGRVWNSTLKPIGAKYTGKTFDLRNETVVDASIDPANDEEIEGTVKVMGGEDWSDWIDLLLAERLLAPDRRRHVGALRDLLDALLERLVRQVARVRLAEAFHPEGERRAARGARGAGAQDFLRVEAALRQVALHGGHVHGSVGRKRGRHADHRPAHGTDAARHRLVQPVEDEAHAVVLHLDVGLRLLGDLLDQRLRVPLGHADGSPGDRAFHVRGRHHHEVGELVDHDDDVRQHAAGVRQVLDRERAGRRGALRADVLHAEQVVDARRRASADRARKEERNRLDPDQGGGARPRRARGRLPRAPRVGQAGGDEQGWPRERRRVSPPGRTPATSP